MTLNDLQRIKRWHVAHRMDHPVEYHLWDMMLTVWLMGWVGWLPAFAFDAVWIAPVLAIAMSAPTMYVSWRMKAHRAQRLRCDWVNAARQ